MAYKQKTINLRKNIDGKRLLGILNNHIVDPENHPLLNTQLKAAEMLLKRTLPELRSIEHKGKIDSKIDINIKLED